MQRNSVQTSIVRGEAASNRKAWSWHCRKGIEFYFLVNIYYYIQQVALKFSHPFWREQLGNSEIFGHVTSVTERRGLFSIFYDISVRKDESDDRPPVEKKLKREEDDPGNFTLMTTVSGKALDLYYSWTDTEIVKQCMNTLRSLFPNQVVPEPDSFILSHWGYDSNVKMSYSFVCVGGTSEDYNTLSKEEGNGKLHFAGEV